MSKKFSKNNSKEKKEKEITWEMFIKSIRILKGYIRPYKKKLILISFFAILGAIMQAFVPYMSGNIIDKIISLSQGSEVVFTLLIFLGIWFILKFGYNIISWKTGFHNEKLSQRLFVDYMVKGIGELFEKSISFHKDKKRGQVWEKVMRASRAIMNLSSRFSLDIIPALLTFIAAIIITFTINIYLTFVLIVAVIIYSLILWRFVPRLAGIQRDINKKYTRAYGSAHDALENVEEVKQNATEEYEKKKMKKNFIEKAMPTFYNIIEIYWKIDSVQKILIILAQLSIFLISIKFIKEGVITTGELVAFNSYASMMFYPFIILGRSWQRIQSGVIELTEAQKIFDSPPEVYKPKDGISIQKLKGEVEFNNVFFKYKESSRVLSDISFKVEPGKKIALVGKSGVGKSTIISLILAINLPTQGKILIDGNRLDKINLTSYRRQVGIVNQEPTLFNDTIRYNIKYGSFGISDEKMIQAAKKAHIHKLIKSLDKGYDQRVGWKGIKLSIGQKQRIALARAFLKDPRILILDEPTSALDAKSEYLIQESLEELMQGKTTFIIAHRLSTIRSVDRILVFEKGKLVEDGSHKELLKNENGTYKSLYDYQIGVYKDQN